ncbi:MAG: ATP-dependent DNA helicase [Deltaproteobacteria bacterium]|nr:ATP-dependent DNA helicase [Deltaproteobacteria bacterium]
MNEAGPPTEAATAPWRAAAAGLAEILPGFEPRPDQAQMLEAVATALDEGVDLLVEAGTGTGKTLAYLLPLLATGRRAIVSTATRQLQEQIVDHDLPTALRAAGTMAKIAVLKGRSNYLCHDRVERAVASRIGRRAGIDARLDRAAAALRNSFDGDVAKLPGLPDDDPLWAEITSNSDNCLGSDCSFVRECFVLRARRRAMDADVVVVNHHVLLADYALRERFDGAALLPAVDAIVVDEAHALEDVVASFFGRQISSRRVERLVADLGVDLDEAAVPPTDPARLAVGGLAEAAGAFFAAARTLPPNQPIDAAIERALQAPREALIDALGVAWLAMGKVGSVSPLHEKLRESLVALEEDVLEVAAPRHDGEDVVRWIEQRKRSTVLCAQPVTVAPILRRTLLAEPATRVFASATLAVGDDFGVIRARLGLDADVRTLCLAGGFDYTRQALLYLDPRMPPPFAPGRDEAVADAILALVQASAGGAFALFSSYRQMYDAVRRLRPRLTIRVLVQGDESKATLLDRFRQAQPAVLFATMGFWQGVDVPGDDLRLVILDKVPFPPPDEPRFAARGASVERMGGNAFAELSIPAAAIALRQGFGRLIRRHDDRGVVAILDPRLATKGYGRKLLAALPPARRTGQLEEVEAFYRA